MGRGFTRRALIQGGAAAAAAVAGAGGCARLGGGQRGGAPGTAAADAGPSGAPGALQVEHLRTALGVARERLRLSWRLPVHPAVPRQAAYQLLCASSIDRLAPGAANRWDPGEVASEQSWLV